jgi:hypothetical protein
LGYLTEDLEETSREQGVPPQKCVAEMRSQLARLVPGERADSPAATHLNSVLTALSHLEQSRGNAARSAA